MSIYSFLKDDHNQIKALMNDIEEMGPEADEAKNEKFNDLKKLLISHSKAEERTFYQPLREFKKTHDEVEHGKEEHEEAETLLKELTNESLVGNAWQQKFLRLKNSVEHHIEEEENEMFTDAKKVLDENEEHLMEANMHIQENKEMRTQNLRERHR